MITRRSKELLEKIKKYEDLSKIKYDEFVKEIRKRSEEIEKSTVMVKEDKYGNKQFTRLSDSYSVYRPEKIDNDYFGSYLETEEIGILVCTDCDTHTRMGFHIEGDLYKKEFDECFEEFKKLKYFEKEYIVNGLVGAGKYNKFILHFNSLDKPSDENEYIDTTYDLKNLKTIISTMASKNFVLESCCIPTDYSFLYVPRETTKEMDLFEIYYEFLSIYNHALKYDLLSQLNKNELIFMEGLYYLGIFARALGLTSIDYLDIQNYILESDKINIDTMINKIDLFMQVFKGFCERINKNNICYYFYEFKNNYKKEKDKYEDSDLKYLKAIINIMSKGNFSFVLTPKDFTDCRYKYFPISIKEQGFYKTKAKPVFLYNMCDEFMNIYRNAYFNGTLSKLDDDEKVFMYGFFCLEILSWAISISSGNFGEIKNYILNNTDISIDFFIKSIDKFIDKYSECYKRVLNLNEQKKYINFKSNYQASTDVNLKYLKSIISIMATSDFILEPTPEDYADCKFEYFPVESKEQKEYKRFSLEEKKQKESLYDMTNKFMSIYRFAYDNDTLSKLDDDEKVFICGFFYLEMFSYAIANTSKHYDEIKDYLTEYTKNGIDYLIESIDKFIDKYSKCYNRVTNSYERDIYDDFKIRYQGKTIIKTK